VCTKTNLMFDGVLLLINQLIQFVFNVWNGERKPSNLLCLHQYHNYYMPLLITYIICYTMHYKPSDFCFILHGLYASQLWLHASLMRFNPNQLKVF